jgi:hypothetical protein
MRTHIGLSSFAPLAPALWAELKHVRALTRAVSGEDEMVLNFCTFLEYVSGNDEIHVTEHGLVTVLLVKATSNQHSQVSPSSRPQDPLTYSAVLRVLI